MQRGFGANFQGGIVIFQIDNSVGNYTPGTGSTGSNNVNHVDAHRRVNVVGGNPNGDIRNALLFYGANNPLRYEMKPDTTSSPNSDFHAISGLLPRPRNLVSGIHLEVLSNATGVTQSMQVRAGNENFGPVPHTGIPDITGDVAAASVFVVVSAALWLSVLIRKRTKNS